MGTGNLRDVSDLLWPAVSETLASLELGSQDAAAKKLAQRYAQIIDAATDGKEQAWSLRWIGPLLLDALTQLGATPVARAKLKKGGDDGEADPLDRLPVRRRSA